MPDDKYPEPNSGTTDFARHAPPVGFKTQYVTALGKSAEYLAEAAREKVDTALAIQGPRALQCTKWAAAVHESGHCVIHALEGIVPSCACIWPVKERGQLQWIGRTDGSLKWRVDQTTTPEGDLIQARSQLAGVIAERLFDPDFRLGSSIDEIVTAQAIILTAARKSQREPESVLRQTISDVVLKLRENECAVRAIANALMLKGCIKGRSLSRLLRLLRGVCDE